MAISHFRSSSSSASAFSSTVSGSRYRKREEGIGASGIYINTYIRPPRSFLSLLITSTRLPPRRKKGWQGGMGVCLFFPLCFFEKGKGSILGYIPIAFYTFGFYYLFFFYYSPSRSSSPHETRILIFLVFISSILIDTSQFGPKEDKMLAFFSL